MDHPLAFVVVCSLFVVTALVASAETEPDQETEHKAYLVTGHVIATAQSTTTTAPVAATSGSDEEDAGVFEDADGLRVETGGGTDRDHDQTDDEAVSYDLAMSVELAEGSFDNHFDGVERALRRLHNNVGACYEDLARQQPELEGKAHLMITIADGQALGSRGELKDVEPTDDPQLSDEVAQCVGRTLSTGRIGRLPPPISDEDPAEAVVVVTYEFDRR